MLEHPARRVSRSTMHPMTRREICLAATAASLVSCARSARSREEAALGTASVAELAAGLHSGRWTSAQLVRLYLERIDSIDRRGPQLRSVLSLNPDALKQAAELDRELKSRGPRSALHGIPILVKDNLDTSFLPTTAGSLALANWRPPKNAPVVQRLIDAGAVILGKTNLSEWANFRSNRSVSGWSAVGGQTRNPHALDRNPSGSSSGSAAAVAASLCAAAIGTETDGSIVSPANACGIAGLKPTVGALPGEGIVPIAPSQDTAGPMARSVRDLAILFEILAAGNSSAYPGRVDIVQTLNPAALRGARIGIPRRFYQRRQLLNRFLDTQVEILKKAGAEIIDEADLPSHGQFGEAEYTVLLYEFKDSLNRYLSRLPESFPARTLEQLIEFNENNREKEMPWFGQEIFVEAQKKGPLSEPAYQEARQKCIRLSRAEGIDAVMDQHRLDALVTLTGGPAWFIDWVNGDSGGGGCSQPAAVAGYPHVTVPAGFIRGLPVGLSFFGRAWSEPRLLQLAHAYEQLTRARRDPALRPGGPAPSAV
ncbi:MAG: amidase [Bryobacteraceae bacterium]|nr:MAG: amidase [Bryobacteraceae bacterium]